jgi:hypothetical protein
VVGRLPRESTAQSKESPKMKNEGEKKKELRASRNRFMKNRSRGYLGALFFLDEAKKENGDSSH